MQPILLTDSIILANITKSDIIKYHTQYPNCVCILNDGRIASSGCDYTINIHNRDNFILDFQIKKNTNSIIYIHQLRNDLLVSCSEDGYLHFEKNTVFYNFKSDSEEIILKPTKSWNNQLYFF